MVFMGILVAGTVGFQMILDEGWIGSFYRAVVSTTLTGLASAPESNAGKIFTVFLLFAGVAVFLYLAGVIVDVMTRGLVSEALNEEGGRRSSRSSATTSSSVATGEWAVVSLRSSPTSRFPSSSSTSIPSRSRWPRARDFSSCWATGPRMQISSGRGIAFARGLVASVDSDEKNLYITLSARAQRPDLVIVARASDESAARKIVLAGANRVVQPYSHAGLHLANLVVKPQVADFLDIVTTAGGPLPDMRFEEIEVTRECGQTGKTIGELRIRNVTGGAVIVALRKPDGTFDVTPGADAVLGEGDVIIGVGTTDEMRRLEELFAPRETAVGA